MNDYEGLFHRKISDLTDKNRYNVEMKQKLNPFLLEVVSDPQSAYEGLLQFIHFDLFDLLKEQDDPVGDMFDYLINIVPDCEPNLPIGINHLADELQEMLNEWSNTGYDKVEQNGMKAELEEFYRSRMIPYLFN